MVGEHCLIYFLESILQKPFLKIKNRVFSYIFYLLTKIIFQYLKIIFFNVFLKKLFVSKKIYTKKILKTVNQISLKLKIISQKLILTSFFNTTTLHFGKNEYFPNGPQAQIIDVNQPNNWATTIFHLNNSLLLFSSVNTRSRSTL